MLISSIRLFLLRGIFVLLCLGLSQTASFAQQSADPTIGPESGLPLPRYVSLKATKANVRRGPSQTNRIDWVFLRRGTPLRVTAEFGHWRRVHDEDGVGGWILYALLSGHRTIVIQAQRAALHEMPSEDSQTVALVEKGVIGSLGKCITGWCEIETDGYSGWIQKTDIWGVGAKELRE